MDRRVTPVCAGPAAKDFAFDWIRDALIALLREVGISRGSPPPDMIASVPRAFVILLVAPSLVVIEVMRVFQTFRERRLWVGGLLAAATLDAVTTIWFTNTSRLSLS